MTLIDERPAGQHSALRSRAPLAWPALVGVVAIGAVGYVAAHNPHIPGATFVCPLYAATGLYCPGCGGTRAVYDLSHGDVAGAFAMHPLLVLLIPLVITLWVRWAARAGGVRLREWPFPMWLAYALPAVLVAFTVLRNVGPFASYLAP